MPFIDALEKIAPLSPLCQTALREITTVQKLKKEHYLVVPGQVNDKLYYIESGLVRVFYYADTDTDSRQVTTYFRQEGSFLWLEEGFLWQQPSLESIELLEDCQFWVIKRADLEQMFVRFPELNFHFRKIAETYIGIYKQRLRLLDLKSAKKRYATFLKLYPKLGQRLQVRHLAHYLNIAPNTLSTVRGEVKKK